MQERYAYSRCMTCGCCLEACPQYDEDHYIGPQAIAQVRLFNMHPSGKMTRDERLEGIMGDDGITNCGNAQNCVKACPMGIPLTTSYLRRESRDRRTRSARLVKELDRFGYPDSGCGRRNRGLNAKAGRNNCFGINPTFPHRSEVSSGLLRVTS